MGDKKKCMINNNNINFIILNRYIHQYGEQETLMGFYKVLLLIICYLQRIYHMQRNLTINATIN